VILQFSKLQKIIEQIILKGLLVFQEIKFKLKMA